jgi:hypothetical protein
MARKTVPVKVMVREVNRMLRNSKCTADIRMGMCAVLDTLLHETNNYRGFQYLREDEVPKGHKPGINLNLDHGDPDRYPDESRRVYNYPPE